MNNYYNSWFCNKIKMKNICKLLLLNTVMMCSVLSVSNNTIYQNRCSIIQGNLILIVVIIQVSGKIKLEFRYTDTYLKDGFDINGHIKSKFLTTALLDHSTEDIVLSPLPILYGMAILALGATKSVLRELEAAIGFTKEGILEEPQGLIQLNMDDKSSLLESLKLFVSSKYELKKDYDRLVKDIFHRNTERIRFTSKDAVCHINKWFKYASIEQVSHGINETQTYRLSDILLATACKWETPFKWIEKDTFYTSEGPINVDMMYLKLIVPYSDENDFESQIISIPLMDSNVQFILMLPKHRDGLYSIIKSLNEYGLNVLAKNINQLEMTQVEIYLPKFTIGSNTELSEVIKKIGLGCLFKQPGLMNIAEGQTIMLSSVINAGSITINQDGIGHNTYFDLDKFKKPIDIEESTYNGKRVKVKYPFFFIIKSGEEQLLAGVYNGNDGEPLFEGPTVKSYSEHYNDNCPEYNPLADMLE